jgi:hypothetical protein
MAEIVDFAAYRRRRAAARGTTAPAAPAPQSDPVVHALSGGPDLYERTVWQNWILLTVLAQCVRLGREAGMDEVHVPALQRAGVLSPREARALEGAVRRHLHPNKPMARERRMEFLALSRRLERRIRRRSAGDPTSAPA